MSAAVRQNRRKAIPLWVKLEVAVRELGMTIADIEFDHDPALARRDWDEQAQDTIPPANDPAYIKIMVPADHKRKTFGTKATTKGSDIQEIARERRLTKGQEEFRRLVLAKPCGQKRERSGKITSRPFPKKPRTFGASHDR